MICHLLMNVKINFIILENSSLPIWPMKYCLICSIYLYGISTVYHTYFCVNKNLSCILLRLDYSGICLIATAGIIPIIQYGFYCNQEVKQIYTVLIFSLCLITWIISLLDFVHKEDFVIYKTLIYVIFYAITFCPLIHLLAFSRLGKLGPHFNLFDIEIGFLTVLFFLIGGITIYTFRIPERYYPIKFDIYVNI